MRNHDIIAFILKTNISKAMSKEKATYFVTTISHKSTTQVDHTNQKQITSSKHENRIKFILIKFYGSTQSNVQLYKFIFMCVQMEIINFNMKITYWREIRVQTYVVDQGAPEGQPCHGGGGRRAPGGGPRRRVAGPGGPSRRSFARGVLQCVYDSVMALS